jgi:hypothetical protein
MTKKAENNKNPEQNPDEGKKRRLANLKPPFKEGEPSANPKGRPKGILNYKTRVTIAIEALTQKFIDDYNKKNPKKKKLVIKDVDILGDVFQQAVNKARTGDMKAIIDLFDRLYGKATQPITLPGSIFNTPEYEKGIKDAEKRMEAFNKKWFKK